MAKRKIGKFVVSDKESLLSLKDGGTIDGALTIAGNITLTGLSNTVRSSSLGAHQLFITSSHFLTASSGLDRNETRLRAFDIVCLTQGS